MHAHMINYICLELNLVTKCVFLWINFITLTPTDFKIKIYSLIFEIPVASKTFTVVFGAEPGFSFIDGY
jgi:hypothetical protein